MQMSYSRISDYWNQNPCKGGFEKFPFASTKGKKVLEIGCGLGADAKRLVDAGADYTGIDLTYTAVEKTRLVINNNYNVFLMNGEHLEFPDESFDIVYSWGVVHHALRPWKVINEARRVLKSGGTIFIMVYGKPSWRYFEIMVLRKILWHLRYWKFSKIRKTYPHPTKEEWISINTDAIGCPLSRVYTKKEAADLIRKFNDIKILTTNKGWFTILQGTK